VCVCVCVIAIWFQPSVCECNTFLQQIMRFEVACFTCFNPFAFSPHPTYMATFVALLRFAFNGGGANGGSESI